MSKRWLHLYPDYYAWGFNISDVVRWKSFIAYLPCKRFVFCISSSYLSFKDASCVAFYQIYHIYIYCMIELHKYLCANFLNLILLIYIFIMDCTFISKSGRFKWFLCWSNYWSTWKPKSLCHKIKLFGMIVFVQIFCLSLHYLLLHFTSLKNWSDLSTFNLKIRNSRKREHNTNVSRT